MRDISRTRAAPLRFGFSAPQITLEAAEFFRPTDPRTTFSLRAANSADLFQVLLACDLDVIGIWLKGTLRPYHCQFFRRQS